jgi:two-component system response regulator GlrR
LRERAEDIPLLAHHFLRQYAAEHHKALHGYTPDAISRLAAHDWPGNVRELEHVVQRAVVLSTGARIGRDDLTIGESAAPPAAGLREEKARVVERFEVGYLERLLAAHEGNLTQAARSAGKNRRAFFELLRKHGIDAGRFRARLP